MTEGKMGLAGYLWQEICELPDRTSPEEYPDMGLVTQSELQAIVETWFELNPASSATEGVEPVAWRCEDLILPSVSIIEDREHAEMRMSHPEAWKVTPLYASPPNAEPAPVVRVKSLEWERVDGGYDYAKTPFVGDYYCAWTEGSGALGCWSKMNTGVNRVDGGRDAAKAAAQADYDTRIRSALSQQPVSSPVGEAVVAIVAAIDELRREEGSSVEILCDNPDFNGQPNNSVICVADWTRYEPHRVSGHTLQQALENAVAHKKMAIDAGISALAPNPDAVTVKQLAEEVAANIMGYEPGPDHTAKEQNDYSDYANIVEEGMQKLLSTIAAAPASPVMEDVTVTDEMVERAVVAHDGHGPDGTAPRLSYTDHHRMHRALTAALSPQGERESNHWLGEARRTLAAGQAALDRAETAEAKLVEAMDMLQAVADEFDGTATSAERMQVMARDFIVSGGQQC